MGDGAGRSLQCLFSHTHQLVEALCWRKVSFYYKITEVRYRIFVLGLQATADFGGDLLFFGVVLFVLFAEPAHFGMLVGMWRVVVRVRAFHFDGFL